MACASVCAAASGSLMMLCGTSPFAARKVLEAQERIRNGEQFATVAAELSEDKARQGGDLGWKGRQDVVGAFAEAAFKLDVRPGSCVGPLCMSAQT